jgi:hypothetical protein
VTLGASSLTQDFSIARAPVGPPRSGAFTFLGSDPAAGGEFSVVDSAGLLLLPLKAQFAIQFETTIPDAKVEVDLLDDAGQRCWYNFVDQPITANQSVTMANTFWVWEGPKCAFPIGTATIKVTLLTLRGPEVNGHLQRTDYAMSTFAARYRVQRYPPPPGGPETPPSISALTWKVQLPVGGDPPIPGDPVTISCTAKESDGAPLTTTITLTWDTLPPQRYTEFFPAGASSSSAGASYAIGVTAPAIPGGAPNARVACLTTNDRGQSASKTTDIGKPK